MYLPALWTGDPERCHRADTDPAVGFATKPELVRALLARAFAAGVPASWVVGGGVYGDARRLRLWLQGQEKAHVLAVSGKEHVWLGGRQHRTHAQVETVRTELPGLAVLDEHATDPKTRETGWIALRSAAADPTATEPVHRRRKSAR